MRILTEKSVEKIIKSRYNEEEFKNRQEMLALSKVLVETSARHVHLSAADLATLFGEGAELTNKKDLSQPGQFACFERVDVIGPKGEIKNVSILGPVRSATQVELSLTDARKVGIAAPIRESGCIENTPGCKLVGPKG